MGRHASLVCALCLGALAATIVGCSTSNGPGGSNGGGMMGDGSGSSSYTSPGQRIFLTAVGSDGQPIAHTASRVARSSLMMGGGGCASCHGADGRGGTLRTMSGTAIKARAARLTHGFGGRDGDRRTTRRLGRA